MAEETDVFVIGTGPSGMTAARTVKMKRPDLSVTAIRCEPSYVPCALPYALGGVIEADSYLKNESKLMTEIGINLLDGEVARIVPEKKQVILADGAAYSYGKLICAPGAEPLVPRMAGIQAPNVFTIRTPADIHRILDYQQQNMPTVVIGGGYIGIETACMMRQAGHQVTLVELLDRVMPRSLDAEFSGLAQERLAAHGVALRLGVGLKELVLGENGAVEHAALADGTSLPAGLVVLALGVKPRLQLFEDASIKTERDGVLVDERMRTSAPDVYACGDCTQFRSFITGGAVAGKLATNGVFQGKTAALNVLGEHRTFEGFVSACATDVFGLRLGAVGIREEDAAEAGMAVITGTGVSRSSYPMFTGSHEVRVKLVLNRENLVVVGGQVAGTQAVAERIDLISLAIQQRLEAGDLAKMHHCAHPLQSGVPAHNPIVMAAEDAVGKLDAC